MTRAEHVNARQVRASLVLLVLMPPLAPLTWILLSGADRPVYLRSLLVRIGIGTLVTCSLPLIGIIVASAAGFTADANPDPVGAGLLFALGVVLSTVLLTAGTLRTFMRLSKPA